MDYHDYLRISVIIASFGVSIFIVSQIWTWHKEPNNFDLRDLLTALGRDKKQHVSRAAVGEMVALAATTSGYLGVLAVKPESYTEATAIYGSLWAIRGGFSTYLRSKAK